MYAIKRSHPPWLLKYSDVWFKFQISISIFLKNLHHRNIYFIKQYLINTILSIIKYIFLYLIDQIKLLMYLVSITSIVCNPLWNILLRCIKGSFIGCTHCKYTKYWSRDWNNLHFLIFQFVRSNSVVIIQFKNNYLNETFVPWHVLSLHAYANHVMCNSYTFIIVNTKHYLVIEQ